MKKNRDYCEVVSVEAGKKYILSKYSQCIQIPDRFLKDLKFEITRLTIFKLIKYNKNVE